jgi:hypothetical protein
VRYNVRKIGREFGFGFGFCGHGVSCWFECLNALAAPDG